MLRRITLLALSGIAVMFVMYSAAPQMAEARILFNTRIDYPVGYWPISVAIGDLDSDGDLDLATANTGSNNVSVLLGNGNGSFQSAVNYGVGESPYSLAIGDLDGDGSLDLAVPNLYSGDVSVLLGNGDGTFQSAVNYGAGESPYSLAIGDLDGDGSMDLAVANTGINNVSVLLGNGDGTFQAAVNFGTSRYPDSVAIGDLNRDGALDLAVANYYSDDVSVFLGNGDGTFQAAVNYGADNHPVSVAIGDLDGDGAPDLAVSNEDSDDVSVLLGNGDGTFQNAVNYDAGCYPLSVAIGDLDGDGALDLAVANSSGNVSVLINISAVVNDFVTFDPDPSTYTFIPDTTGCPAGCVGKFNFDANLANISDSVLSNLLVEVEELSNDNLLFTDEGLLGQGERLRVPKRDDYTDGELSPDEEVDVPFTVCLKCTDPFRLFVDVLGLAKGAMTIESVAEVPSSDAVKIYFIEAMEVLDLHPNQMVFITENQGAYCGGGTPASAWKMILDPNTGDMVGVEVKQSLTMIQHVHGGFFENSEGTLFTGGGWCGYKPPYFSADEGETWQPANHGVHPPNSTYSFVEFNGNVYAGTGYEPYHGQVYRWLGDEGDDHWEMVLDIAPPRSIVGTMAVYKGQLFIGSEVYGWGGSGCNSSVPVYVSTDGSTFNATTGIPPCYSVSKLLVVGDQLVAQVYESIHNDPHKIYMYYWNKDLWEWEEIGPYNLRWPSVWTGISCRAQSPVTHNGVIYAYGWAPSDTSPGIYQSVDMGQSWEHIAVLENIANSHVTSMKIHGEILYLGTRVDASDTAYIYRLKLPNDNLSSAKMTSFDLGADPKASVQSGGGSSGGCFISTQPMDLIWSPMSRNCVSSTTTK